MKFWDFDETLGFVKETYNQKPYKVLNLKNKKLVAKRLYQSDALIHDLSNKMRKDLPCLNGVLKNMAITFLSIHPDYYYLQEIPQNSVFEGLNKPKNIHFNLYLPSVGYDKNLKAEYRGIFLRIRKDEKIKSFDELVPLIIHELAHTGCNHVKFRENDHNKDFKIFEMYLYYLYFN
jgi:hypothetical protein